MQKIELHPTSLLAGAVLAVLTLVAMAPTPPPASTAPTPPGLIPARNMVQIKEGVPYVVPVGQLLVITGLGSTGAVQGSSVVLNVNGVQEVLVYSAVQSGTGFDPEVRSIVPVPAGLAIPAGSVVLVDDNTGPTLTGRAWGYVERY
jgi:hypothetical protein